MKIPEQPPEFRKDPVSGDWVITASIRAKRPFGWINDKNHDNFADCPFCPGNEKQTPPELFAIRKSNSKANASDWSLRVIPNKFPVLMDHKNFDQISDGIYEKISGSGAHEVVIETADHNKELSDLSIEEMQAVLTVFKDRINNLKRLLHIKYVLVFKNHGQPAGASLIHSHSQIIATPMLPKRLEEEIEGITAYHSLHQRCIFCDMIQLEQKENKRIVELNAAFIALTPYSSRFPFEIWIMPVQHQHCYEKIEEDIFFLAHILKATLRKIQVVLNFPSYNFVIHTSPCQEYETKKFHWHIELMPKLTHIAGFERGAGCYINSVLPEMAAEMLNRQKAIHLKK